MLLHWGQRSLISPVQSYLLANFPASYCQMGIGTARLLLSSFLLTCLFVISTTASVMKTHRLILIGRFNIFIYSLALVHIVLQLFFCGCLYINSLFPIKKKSRRIFGTLKNTFHKHPLLPLFCIRLKHLLSFTWTQTDHCCSGWLEISPSSKRCISLIILSLVFFIYWDWGN